MFIPYSFASVNQAGQLRRGVYRADVAIYAGAPGEPCASLIAYTHDADHEPCAVDLVVMESDGSVRARDFLWLPDRSWRDSAGTTAGNLAELLPAEVQGLQHVGSDRWPDVHLEEVQAL